MQLAIVHAFLAVFSKHFRNQVVIGKINTLDEVKELIVHKVIKIDFFLPRFIENLWSNVRRCPTNEKLRFKYFSRQSKVCNFEGQHAIWIIYNL